MKKYDVYGIGNALVDMEYEVTDTFLNKMNLSKGNMTLVDRERQYDLVNALQGVRRSRCCGGSAANTVIAVSQFGGKSFYSCKVANDESGDFYLQDILDNGVKTNMNGDRVDGLTGKCMVFVTPDADRTMNTFLGTTADLSDDEVVKDEIVSSEWLYIEGYLVSSDCARSAAIKSREIAQANGVKVAVTFSDPTVVKHNLENFKLMMGSEKVDLVFCNQNEALAFTNELELTAAAEKLKKITKAFAITLGAKGALVYDGRKEIAVVTKKVDAVDTNGAGDLFAGSFLYAITHGHSFIGAGRLACNAASVLVSQFGSRLTEKQAQEVKGEIFDE